MKDDGHLFSSKMEWILPESWRPQNVSICVAPTDGWIGRKNDWCLPLPSPKVLFESEYFWIIYDNLLPIVLAKLLMYTSRSKWKIIFVNEQ